MERILVFNPMYDKIPQGGAEQEDTVRFELKIEKSYELQLYKVALVIQKDGQKEVEYNMEKHTSTEQYARYVYMHKFGETGIYWYYFIIEQKNGNRYFLHQGEDLNAEGTDKVYNKYMQLVTVPQKKVASFLGGTMYHIFVDRFCNKNADPKDYEGKVYRKDWGGEVNSYIGQKEILNNEFFGGNFDGIVSKLDYLKELGVNTIYLSPIAKSNSNHKYDTGDYLTIAPEFGGEKAFVNLINKAKEKDIGIIIDGVYNHTGADSIYFNMYGNYNERGAYQSMQSPYYSWYTFDKYPNDYACWWDVKILPQINKDSEDFQNFICDEVIPYYLDLGVYGIRFDVVDELSNAFVERIATKTKSYDRDILLIGEVWEDASNKFAYGVRKKYFEDNLLHSVMNYPIKDAIINYCLTGDENPFIYNIRLIKDHYPKAVQDSLMNILGTHDTRRILSVLGTGDNSRESSYKKTCYTLKPKEFALAKRRLKIASLLQFTIMGVPCIYYGDEVGLQGDNDPYNRRCFPWDNIDKELLDWYKTLAKIRKNEAFKRGDFNVLYGEQGVLVYERNDLHDRVLIIINNGKYPFEANIENKMKNMINGHFVQGDVVVAAGDFLVLEKTKK